MGVDSLRRMTLKKLLAVGAAAAALVAAVAVDANASEGGKPVGSAPWAVQVRVQGFCSGSIVAPHWVATAAHCTGNSTTGSVLVGAVRRNEGQPANVTQIHRHGDFALLRLDRDVAAQYLPLATQEPPLGAFPVGYGWGRTCPTCPVSDILHSTRMVVSGGKIGHNGSWIVETHDTGDGLPSIGDSGGPLILDGKLIGTLSTIFAINNVFFAEYDSVAAIGDWISSVTGGELRPGTNPPGAGSTVKSNWNGKCIDVPAGNFADGQRLSVWDCHGGVNQRWEFVGGTLRTQNNMCMDVAWGSHDNGAAIQIVTCNGNPAQQFVLNNAGDLVNPQADKCVDIAGWNGDNGALLHLWQCVGGANQKWHRA